MRHKKDQSLQRWLFRLSIWGTAVMCLIIIAISMIMYMHSVRRIYKSEMLQDTDAAIDVVGNDKLYRLCTDLRNEPDKDENGVPDSIESIEMTFRHICAAEGLSDIALYSYDTDTGAAVPLVRATGDALNDDPIELDYEKYLKMAGSESRMQLAFSGNTGWNYSVYKTLEDDSGDIYGLMRSSISVLKTWAARIRFMIVYTPICILLIIVFATLASRSLKKRIVDPLADLNGAALAFSRSDARALNDTDHTCFNIPGNLYEDEIGALWKTCSDMETSLYASVNELETVTAEREREAAEVDVAAQIQAGMLPGMDPMISARTEFTLHGSMTPARGVGGDFYDYFMMDDDHLAMVIGDVSGKGIPAAMFMMMSMTQIRSRAAGNLSPAAIITAVNDGICANNPQMMFVTVWMGILELSTGTLRECNAGHEYVAVRRDGGGYELDMTEHDMPVGLMEGVVYTDHMHSLHSGDRIFVYSDGVPEAADPSEEQFGTDRMLEALNRDPAASDEQILDAVRTCIADFVQDAPQYDDLTMLSFTVS